MLNLVLIEVKLFTCWTIQLEAGGTFMVVLKPIFMLLISPVFFRLVESTYSFYFAQFKPASLCVPMSLFLPLAITNVDLHAVFFLKSLTNLELQAIVN